MESQTNIELLDKILEDDMISLSGGESDVVLLGADPSLDVEKDLDTTKPYSIIGELIDGPPTHHTKYQHSSITTTSTIFSTVSGSLSTMTTSTTHSTTNTTSPTPTKSHNDTRQSTAPAHIGITTTTKETPSAHILKTLPQHTTITIPSISTSPPLGALQKSSPLPTIFNKELSIIKIVEDYLMKQNKHKNGNENKNSNKKFWITNPDSLQGNTNPLHQSTLHQSTLRFQLILPQSDKTLNQDPNSTLPP